MDLAWVIRHRLEELGYEQRDLAIAAQVTESYISQLLTRKKTPPATDRTGIYEKMEQFLELPSGELARLADLQRRDEWKKKLVNPPAPLFQEIRELILRKCDGKKRPQIQAIFEKQPFGEFERLITQTVLDTVKKIARRELLINKRLRAFAKLGNRSHEEMRVSILEFLDTDIFHVSAENCISFLDPLVESWDIDLTTFGISIRLNEKLDLGGLRRFEFVETEPQPDYEEEPGFKEFLGDAAFRIDVSEEEIAFLRNLRFRGRRPLPLYYYREIQNLRDPLHFRPASAEDCRIFPRL
jgi:transcriptional regulator with XRE-family HTH domain